MTTPVAAATRTGGRTSQARGPAPDRFESGRIQGGASSPGRTRTARPRQAKAPTQAQIRTSQRKSLAQSNRQQRQQRQSQEALGRKRRQHVEAIGKAQRRAPSAAHATDYQKIIAAEFVIAEVLIAITPMTSRKNGGGISPYVPRDMTKMLAIGVLYLLLELLAIPAGWGRIMAWFGGLILLVVGLNEAANVVSDIDALAGFTPKKKTGGETAGG